MSERQTIVIFSSNKRRQYFFSEDHCQKHSLGEGWIPTSHALPSTVIPRHGLENGVIDTVEKLIKVYYPTYVAIANPDVRDSGRIVVHTTSDQGSFFQYHLNLPEGIEIDDDELITRLHNGRLNLKMPRGHSFHTGGSVCRDGLEALVDINKRIRND